MPKRIGIQIDPRDNVVTVVEEALPGDDVEYVTPDGPQLVTASQRIPLGHKIAARDVRPQDPVVKYNQPIGTASTPIDKGQHVHVHNVRSAVQGAEGED